MVQWLQVTWSWFAHDRVTVFFLSAIGAFALIWPVYKWTINPVCNDVATYEFSASVGRRIVAVLGGVAVVILFLAGIVLLCFSFAAFIGGLFGP